MESILAVLNSNSGAITAIAAVAGVLVAAVYTLYTTKLWRVSELQAKRTAELVESGKRQLQLTEQQIAFTQRTFDAVNRPQLLIDAHLATDQFQVAGRARDLIRITARNFGAMSATVMSVECRVHGWDGTVTHPRFMPIVIPAGETEGIGSALLSEAPAADPVPDEKWPESVMRWIHVSAQYKGLDDKAFSASAQIGVLPSLDAQPRWKLMGATPTGPEFWAVHGDAKSR